jgi:uncharacterized protein
MDFIEFEWDDEKARTNLKKHGVRFTEAVTIWLDDSALEIPDPEHSHGEERWIRMGLSRNANALVVVYVEKIENKSVRIVSARKASRSEEDRYSGE